MMERIEVFTETRTDDIVFLTSSTQHIKFAGI
jgi:hypothetical protein